MRGPKEAEAYGSKRRALAANNASDLTICCAAVQLAAEQTNRCVTTGHGRFRHVLVDGTRNTGTTRTMYA